MRNTWRTWGISWKEVGIGAVGFLVGLAAEPALAPVAGVAGLLAGTTGLVLLATLKACDWRMALFEERAAALDARRRETEAENRRLERFCRSIAETVASALDGIPHADGLRSRVPHLALALGREMRLNEDTLAGLHMAALLHDIGRIYVPSEIWEKPGPLTPEEWEQVRRYPEQGAAWLAPIAFPWPVVEIIRGQQERWDGTGYPDGLFGRNIPLGARLLAVVDTYDALVSPRPYRAAMPHTAAMATLAHDSGRRFDPDVVQAFRRVAARGEFMEMAGALEEDRFAAAVA